jgi:Protein of unknown function (DUF3830)
MSAGAVKLAGCRWVNSNWNAMGQPVGFENHTSHPSAGDILFYPWGYSETQLLIAYGGCSFASRMGRCAARDFCQG